MVKFRGKLLAATWLQGIDAPNLPVGQGSAVSSVASCSKMAELVPYNSLAHAHGAWNVYWLVLDRKRLLTSAVEQRAN